MATPPAKQIKVLLINPNATAHMTHACVQSIRSTLPPDVIIEPFTAPAPAPTAIEGNVDAILSSAAAFRALLPIADQYDAFVVACFSVHPLIGMIREEFSQPVIGIMEASLLYARTLGARLGLVATSARAKVQGEDGIALYGFQDSVAGVEHCGLGVLELESKKPAEVQEIMLGVARKLVDQGADVLTLGCAGMTGMREIIEKDTGLPVVDGVLAAVHHVIGVVRIGGKTGKRGVYRSSKAQRESRGQTYV